MSHDRVPTVGRIVHVVLDDGPNAGEHRAALVVRAWGTTTVELAVFLALEDRPAYGPQPPVRRCDAVPHDEQTKAPGTWHYPEREEMPTCRV